MLNKPKTIICDIDGTLIKHHGSLTEQILVDPEILQGTIEKLNEWDRKGYKIILLTGRKKSMRKITKMQLLKLGIFYDQLVMGATNGERIIINDLKENNETLTASAVCIKRNFGIKNIDI